MPELAPVVSATMVPMNAPVIASLIEPKNCGSARGIETLNSTSSLRAPSERSTSSSSGEDVTIAVDTMTMTGKKQTTVAVRTAICGPAPNHTTKTGISATLGIECSPINDG